MSSLENRIKDLVQFYVKTNYEQYMMEHHITIIPDTQLEQVITNLYDERKEHLKVFIKQSLQSLLKSEYPGDLVVLNILMSIFEDDTLCRNRLVLEVKLHQESLQHQT
jgi:hypothetical protein